MCTHISSSYPNTYTYLLHDFYPILTIHLDFSSALTDRPLIVQFGASNALDFSRAAEMAMPYCDGIDLNCGCPQSWAIGEGIGCKLMSTPELVRDMVMAAKKRCGEKFSVSVKIRIHLDLE